MLKKIFYNVLATTISTMGGIVRNKIYAALLSLSLFGILSIGMQSASLLFTFFAFGLPLGVTTLSSQLVNKSEVETRETISRILILTCLAASFVLLVLLIIICIDSSWLSQIITNKSEYAFPISLLLLSAPFMMIENCMYAIMEGMGKLKEIIIFKIIPAFLIPPLLYLLTSKYYFIGAAISVLVSEASLCLVAMMLLRKHFTINRKAFQIREVFVKIFKVAMLSFAVGVLWLGSDFVVKRYVLGVMGEIDNGIVQSVARITDLYPSIALAWLSMHLFPSLAAQQGNPTSLARILERTTVIAVAIIIPVIIFLFVFRSLILEFIFQKEFLVAQEYFGAMLSTGIVKVYSWVLGVGLLAVGLRKEWFYSALLMTAVYLVGAWAGFFAHLGIYALPLTFGIGLTLQSVYCLYVYRKQKILFDSTFGIQTMVFTLFSIAFIGSVYWRLMLVVVVMGYVYFLYRYRLMYEIIEKLNGFFRKTA